MLKSAWILAVASLLMLISRQKELARIPVFGRAWQACGHISVDRANRASAIQSAGRRGTDLPPTGRTPIGRCSGDIEVEFRTRLRVSHHRSE